MKAQLPTVIDANSDVDDDDRQQFVVEIVSYRKD